MVVVAVSHKSGCQTFVLTVPQGNVLKTGEVSVEEALLEGHLGITKELLCLQTPEKKYAIGADKDGPGLIKVCTTTLEHLYPCSQ